MTTGGVTAIAKQSAGRKAQRRDASRGNVDGVGDDHGKRPAGRKGPLLDEKKSTYIKKGDDRQPLSRIHGGEGESFPPGLGLLELPPPKKV